MAKLSNEQIAAEVGKKNLTLIDATGYTNMQSRIKVKCPNGHLIETCIDDVRHPSFECPQCNAAISFVNPNMVPQKKGYRIIAFDQATEHFGLSIFDNGELVFYHLYLFTGDVLTRLEKIDKFINEVVIPAWQPDWIVMEDIQLQSGNVTTYKILAMLLGIIEINCVKAKVKHEVVSPNVWRKYAGTCGKTRQEEKMLSVAVVKEKYNIKVSDDIAEAILIGRYGAKMHTAPIQTAFGDWK